MFETLHPTRAQLRLVAACAATLAAAPCAIAAPNAPGGLTSSAGIATAAVSTNVAWRALTADPGATIIRYEGGLVATAAAEPIEDFGLSTSVPVPLGAEGVYLFKVRAVQSDLAVGAYSTLPLTVDRRVPQVTVTMPPPNGLNGWHVGPSGLRITPICIDATPVTGCAPIIWTTQTRGATQDFTVTDAAGNRASASSASFAFDRIAPTPRGLLQPAQNAILASEPTYTWTRFDDGTSGTDRYEVLYRIGNGGPYSPTPLAIVPHPAPGASATLSTVRNVLATPLPSGQDLWWRVRTFDRAGNSSLTSARRMRINPAAAAAPVITAGPSGATNVTGPTFSWTGDQPIFAWDVSGPDQDEPVQAGTGAATQVTLGALADGDYTFRVSQSSPGSASGAEATRPFEVDTIAPPAPVVTRRPAIPSVGDPTFSWSTVIGAFGRWTLLGSVGATVQGPSDAPTGSVTLGGLAGGTYELRLVAVDPAGNASPAVSESFAISVPSPLVQPTATPRAPILPTLNSYRLRPRANVVLSTRRPVLRWNRGPRGTTLYNVQLFRVGKKNAAGQLTLTKVLSRFPRTPRLRLTKKLESGACYIWRVWPYIGVRFAPKPLGVSNFCVASAKALRAGAKAARAKPRR